MSQSMGHMDSGLGAGWVGPEARLGLGGRGVRGGPWM